MSYKFDSTGNFTAERTDLTGEISKDWPLHDVNVSILLTIINVLGIDMVLDKILSLFGMAASRTGPPRRVLMLGKMGCKLGS